MALKSDAVAEKPKDQLSRDFLGCSIFDFCNNIGTKRTCRPALTMSVLGVDRKWLAERQSDAIDPNPTFLVW